MNICGAFVWKLSLFSQIRTTKKVSFVTSFTQRAIIQRILTTYFFYGARLHIHRIGRIEIGKKRVIRQYFALITRIINCGEVAFVFEAIS